MILLPVKRGFCYVRVMENDVKSYLSAILTNARDQKKEVGELAARLEAAIAALRALVPGFEAEYERNVSGQDVAELREETERSLAAIETAIQGLSQR